MRSAFFELNVATTGLFTARASLDTVANNISNAETKGYSRQVTLQKAARPMSTGGKRGMIGTGSEVYGVQQIRSSYLDSRYRAQNPILGEYSVKYNQNILLQTILNEVSSSGGFNSSVNNFFEGLQDLSTNSGDLSYRTSLITSAETLTTYFNNTAQDLLKQQSILNQEVSTIASQINSIGFQIQNLNYHITNIELDGVSVANDLRDQRNVLIDDLSKLVNVEVRETPHSTLPNRKNFSITIDGHDFIYNTDLNELECRERTFKNNPEDADGLYDIYWKATGDKMNTNSSTLSGELKGTLAIRDGNNSESLKGSVSEVTRNDDGTILVTLDNVNRLDMQEQGNITINGRIYAYSDLQFDSENNTATLKIPPNEGLLSVGSQKVSYSDLTVDDNGRISLNFSPALDNLAGSILRIGDMILSGNITPVTNADGKITGATVGSLSSSTNSTEWFNDITSLPANANAQISNNADYKGIPFYISELNEFVRTFARALNEGCYQDGESIEGVQGFMNGINLNGDTGYNFFSYKTNSSTIEPAANISLDYSKITAANFSVAQEMLDDPNNMGCASSENPDKDDNSIVESLITLKNNDKVFKEGKMGDFLSSIIAGLGVGARQAEDIEKTYTDIIMNLENQKLSVSGVDIDEEVAKMIKYNQTYSAAAKLVSIIDSIYDTTINKMGV